MIGSGKTRWIAVALVIAAAALPAAAQQEQKMTPEQQKAMEAWMKYATPGPDHALLEPFVGSWDVTVTWWEAPGAPPGSSKGTSENVWVLGGRFVQQAFAGELAGQAFSGIGYTGYDNLAGRFLGTWMDTMGTTIMVTSGTADASGKVMTFTGEMADAVSGKMVSMREVIRVVDRNRHVFEMYAPDPAGKEYKSMEIVYTRR